MELLDRYLQAVKFWLPKGQREDIAAELGDDIWSRIEEEEGGLGRKLNQAEVAAILKQSGRPLLVASRYLPQESLIGPVLFPIYRFVLKIVVWYPIAWLLVSAGLMIFFPNLRGEQSLGGSLLQMWGPLWHATLTVVVLVTLVFAVLERVQARSHFLQDWDPVKLPPARDPGRISRVNSAVELGANAILIAVLIGATASGSIYLGGGVRVDLMPVWQGFFWAFLLLGLANITLAAANLFQPHWTSVSAGTRLILDCAGMVAFCWLLKASVLAGIVAPNLSPARATEIAHSINAAMVNLFPLAVVACVIIVAISNGARLFRLGTGRTPQTHLA